MSGSNILEMENITKEFPGVKALDNVSLYVKRGSIHALVGENGAGKSTLMNILIGIYKPDKGHITFNGEQLIDSNIRTTISKGISMIHQELSPIHNMTVAENIFLGREPAYSIIGWVKKKEMVENTIVWSEIEARLRFNAKHPLVTWWRIPRVMLPVFWNYYITQGGWRVGTGNLLHLVKKRLRR